MWIKIMQFSKITENFNYSSLSFKLNMENKKQESYP